MPLARVSGTVNGAGIGKGRGMMGVACVGRFTGQRVISVRLVCPVARLVSVGGHAARAMGGRSVEGLIHVVIHLIFPIARRRLDAGRGGVRDWRMGEHSSRTVARKCPLPSSDAMGRGAARGAPRGTWLGAEG